MPSKASFARDHWGYYNGRTLNSSLIPVIQQVYSQDYITHLIGVQGNQRDANPDYVNAFTLSSLKYPTGGSTEFQYEANDYDEKQSMINDHSFAGKHPTLVSKSVGLLYNNQGTKGFLSTDTADLSDQYIYFDPLYGSSPQQVKLTVAFRFSSQNDNICNLGTGKLTFSIQDLLGNDLVAKDYQNFDTCSNSLVDNCIRCGSRYNQVATYKTNLYLAPGKYKIVVHSDNSLTSIQDIRFTFEYLTSVSIPPNDNVIATIPYHYAGGLRIKRIIDHDAINAANDKIRKFNYHYFQDRDNNGVVEEYSYGRRMTKPQYTYFEWSDEFYLQSSGGTTQALSYQAAHFIQSSDSYVPLNGSASGSVVGYDHVTVLEGENGENGKTDYSYFNQPDFVADYIEYGGLPSRPPYGSTLPNPLNGKLLEQVDYKNVSGQFVKIKSLNNTYTLQQEKENRVYGMQVKPRVLHNWGIGHIYQGTGTHPPCSDYLYSHIALQSEWIHLDATDEKIFDPVDITKYVQNITNYFYDNYAHLLPNRVVTTNSKGEIVTTSTTYPLDYPILTSTDALTKGILNLKTKHIINAPVERYVKKENSDGSNVRVTSGIISSYDPSVALPKLVYATETASPITNFLPLNINATAANLDIRYKPQIYFDAYDTYGNIIQQHKVNDNPSAYIWGYNSSLPIAECSNAIINDIAYTSFEAEGAIKTGNWGFTGAPVADHNPPSGKLSYRLSAGDISNYNLTNSKSYILSYWSKSGPQIVSNNPAITVTGNNVNGWVYYEYKITNTTSVIISGQGTIDELRLYPVGSQMNTYTYDPLFGITSKGDENNDFTYYEYDAFSRLKLVKDQNQKVLKKYCYNYAGQPEGCTTAPVSVALTSTNPNLIAGFTATYTNTNTGAITTYNISGTGTTSQALTYVSGTNPLTSGNYNLSISKPNNITLYTFGSGCGSFSTDGTSAMFYNISISPSLCNQISLLNLP